MSATFLDRDYTPKRGDQFVADGMTWVVSQVTGTQQQIDAVRADGLEEIITNRDELVRKFALLQAEGVEVPELRRTSLPRPLAGDARDVHYLREERRRFDLQMLELSKLRRNLERNLSRRDVELKREAFSVKEGNEKTRDAAYRLSLTEDFDYLQWQSQLDAVDDRRADLQVEIDALRREYRTAEVDYEAEQLGRRNAA
jgi:hypothetical protein